MNSVFIKAIENAFAINKFKFLRLCEQHKILPKTYTNLSDIKEYILSLDFDSNIQKFQTALMYLVDHEPTLTTNDFIVKSKYNELLQRYEILTKNQVYLHNQIQNPTDFTTDKIDSTAVATARQYYIDSVQNQIDNNSSELFSLKEKIQNLSKQLNG